ncbi:phospholipase A2-like [Nerophis ophidion]|uniref:phospholipase A2-like n=1 Tax=Nerophis ophidion TaxID=159077 RepID=UPI002AE098E5|nr:phospholipase A2-like [Nerophis ophidion]
MIQKTYKRDPLLHVQHTNTHGVDLSVCASAQKSPAMSAFHLTLLLLAVTVASVAASASERGKRSLKDLHGLIKCTTGRNYNDYSSYGCYCGNIWKGQPVDQTDKCCFNHGCCYARAEKAGCKTDTDYNWTCRDKTAFCGDYKDKCKKLVCECDREFANCLKDAHYDLQYSGVRKLPCFGSKPLCAYYRGK